MNYRFLKKILLFLCVIYFDMIGSAQQTIAKSTDITTFNNGLKLYHTKAYAAAQKTFKTAQENANISANLRSDAAYYGAMCAIKLSQPDAEEQVLSFIMKYPNSNKKNTAFLNIANYYFANKKAAYAIKWYQKVTIKKLSTENQKALHFNLGYSFLVTNNLTLSKKEFLPLINDEKYGNDARYYYGFIAYKLEDYGIAESTLKEIAHSASFKAEISYYLLDISFKTGKFERCVEVGLKLISTIDEKLKSDVSKIIGESYFNLEEYLAAIPFLKVYQGNTKNWSNTDFYQLGYAYFKQNDFKNAGNNFNKIIDEKNIVAQNAYYHLGECYMNLNQKSAALSAFKSAAQMSFNRDIQEDAALNYAKLSYEEGNPFQSVSDVLQDYLKSYPKSKSYQEINELVVASFLHQQNYKGALKFLSEKKSIENNAFRLEVALYRGMQLFNENDYQNALFYFALGKKSESVEIRQKSQYWEAETSFRLASYRDALFQFTSLNSTLKDPNTRDFANISYAIGYTYFKLEEYQRAASYFIDFLKITTISNVLKEDSFIRLGDCYFANGNYTKAISAYQKVFDNFGTDADYAGYQIGMSYGFILNKKAKVIALKKVTEDYPNSNLRDDALYQLGNTYSELQEYKKAQVTYDSLLEKYPKSVFVPRTLLRQGLLYFNADSNKQSIQKYKEVASKFPNSAVAIEAVSNAKSVYIADDNLAGFLDWVATLTFINISPSELDNTTFEIAEKKYLNLETKEDSTNSLEKYLNEFPEGAHKTKANYYLASFFFKVKKIEKAVPYYQFIIAANSVEYTEESLSKLAQIYLDKREFNQALPLLKRLEQEGYIIENIIFAQSNLMQGYYEQLNYPRSIEYALKILKIKNTGTELENDAKTIVARASIEIKDFSTAAAYYADLETSSNGILKAEALYYNAYFKNEQKEYEASNDVVQELIAKYTTYKYWAVKSYVVMGKNYYGLKDVYQATFVLENVIKNFSEFEEIIKDAERLLKVIKETEAKINNSVTPVKKN